MLQGLIRNAKVVEIDGAPIEGMGEPNEPGAIVNKTIMLYKKGVPSDTFTLILQGEINVEFGEENFESELGPWSVLGRACLVHNFSYIPDYTAFACGPCRLVRIVRNEFLAALKAAQMETVVRPRAIRKNTMIGSFASSPTAGQV